LTLVLDASLAVPAALFPDGFDRFGGHRLVAPPLMWSEARSVLHEALWRSELQTDEARSALLRLEAAPVSSAKPSELGEEAWRVADAFGWAKAYDAEYVALAKLLRCRLVTADERLRRAARSLGFVITLGEL
jgi:predicted nucleic acid-binding protein